MAEASGGDGETHVVKRRLLRVGDGLLAAGGMALAYALHPVVRQLVPQVKAPAELRGLILLGLLFLPAWIALLSSIGLDRMFDRPWSAGAMLRRLLQASLGGVVAFSVITFVTQAPANRSLVAMSLAITTVLTGLQRWMLSTWMQRQYEAGVNRRCVLVFGEPGAAVDRYRLARKQEPFPPAIVERQPGKNAEKELRKALHDEAADEVAFFPPCASPDAHRRLVAVCEELGRTALFALPQPDELGSPRVVQAGEQAFICYTPAFHSPSWLALKHLGDGLAAALLVVLLSPLLVVAAVAVAVTMGRPILFEQQRIGLNGRRFSMLKFRTMVQDAEAKKAALRDQNETGGVTFKMTRDPRVTPLGRLLRRSSIDELPQLFNVLSGSMSLVGPRPLPVDEQQAIEGAARRRLAMRPGITGLWQVSGRSHIGFDDWMALDLRYVDDWSPWLDLRILLKTIPAVVRGRGAH